VTATYVDSNLVSDPATGNIAPASLGDTWRDNGEWFARNHGHCRITHSGTQSLANATWTPIVFNVDLTDVGGMHSVVVNTDRVVIPVSHDGTFDFGGCVEFETNATGVRELAISLNGGPYIIADSMPALTGTASIIGVDTEYPVVAGDILRLLGYQSSGGALLVQATAEYSPVMTAHWKSL
jgi:hypothetical protein